MFLGIVVTAEFGWLVVTDAVVVVLEAAVVTVAFAFVLVVDCVAIVAVCVLCKPGNSVGDSG